MVWPNAKSFVLPNATHYSVNIHPQSIAAWFSSVFHLFFIHFTEWIMIWKFVPTYFAYLISHSYRFIIIFCDMTIFLLIHKISLILLCLSVDLFLPFLIFIMISGLTRRKEAKKQRRQFNKPIRKLIWTINYLACWPLTHEINWYVGWTSDLLLICPFFRYLFWIFSFPWIFLFLWEIYIICAFDWPLSFIELFCFEFLFIWIHRIPFWITFWDLLMKWTVEHNFIHNIPNKHKQFSSLDQGSESIAI